MSETSTIPIQITFRYKNRILKKITGHRNIISVDMQNYTINHPIFLPESIDETAYYALCEYLLEFNKHKPLRLKKMSVVLPEYEHIAKFFGFKNSIDLWDFELKIKKYKPDELKINIDGFYDLNRWCKKHCKGTWYIKIDKIYFSDDSDQALYRLIY